MFPLHIWLPDAMEGPTPVSALIHAATMVVAGVYLVARLFPVFAISTPVALDIVAVVGIFSALFAAIVACTQTDIKRVLAYSTMSQIGFMMFSLGVSGYSGEIGLGFTASMFHLFTHAFFKALLFLGAGVIIHYIHSNDMNDMGGLRKKMPVTHVTFLIACLAISGIPPFAGFFSKEEILLAAYHSNRVIYWLAVVTSGLTAFYMFRLFYSIFYRRENHSHHEHHGEGSPVLLAPLMILSIGAIAAGFIAFGTFVTTDGQPLESHMDWGFSAVPVLFAVAGILMATLFFLKEKGRAENISSSMGSIYSTIKNKFYIDEIYLFVTKKIIFRMVAVPAAWIDRNIVDGTINLIGRVTEVFSLSTAGIQSGKIQSYAAWMLAGAIGLAVFIIYLFNVN
jgi:NADH-quinone oxidoreductase subunit L